MIEARRYWTTAARGMLDSEPDVPPRLRRRSRRLDAGNRCGFHRTRIGGGVFVAAGLAAVALLGSCDSGGPA